MKLKISLFFIILIILTSCIGYTKKSDSKVQILSKNNALGDTVKKLGNHLWYLYQDKHN